MTGKRKIVAVAVALCITLGLTVVPLAAAYKVPGPPGSPGGKPTRPTGGNKASKRLTKAAARSLAGYTGLELALQTPVVRFKFPKAGVAFCSVSAGNIRIGSGSASKGSSGSETFGINFTNSGRMYLYTHNGQAISLTVTCSFVPKHGVKSTSTSTVVLDP